MIPDDMKPPPDHEDRMAVARRWAQWYLGDPRWAGGIIEAYMSPKVMNKVLDALDEEGA